MNKLIQLIFFWGLLVGCRPNPDLKPHTEAIVIFNFEHLNDGQIIASGPLQYHNIAGNTYSVSRLQYLISDIQLENDKGEIKYFSGPWYIDAFDNRLDTLQLPPMKSGSYILRFNIGLDSALNTSYAWDMHFGFAGMAWPDLMGGGYHFLKLEGRFLDSNQISTGYAFHLGKSANRINHHPIPFAYNSGSLVTLMMDVNRWFGPPIVWNLLNMPSHTMTNEMAMQNLALNGKEVFRN